MPVIHEDVGPALAHDPVPSTTRAPRSTNLGMAPPDGKLTLVSLPGGTTKMPLDNLAVATTTAELDRLFASLKNWGRWGDDDERGRAQPSDRSSTGAALRRLVVARPSWSASPTTCRCCRRPRRRSRPITTCSPRATPSMQQASRATRHAATTSEPRCTGSVITHIDALSHMFVRGEMYNGRPPSDVRSTGAQRNTVMTFADGLVGPRRPARHPGGPRR